WSDAAQRSLDAWPRSPLAERRTELQARGSDPFGALDNPPWFADRRVGRVALTPTDARALHASAPEDLSPGAALRPALQQAALPVAVYLGGPGEIAYHAAIAPVYAALGVPRPLLVPRCSLTLLPNRVERALAHWGIDPRDVGATAPAPVLVPPGDSELSALDAAIDRVEGLTLPDDARRRRDAGIVRVRREAQRLRLSLARGRRRSEDLPAYGALRAWLWPRSQRQERVLGLVPAIWEHGPGIAAAILANARNARPGEHRHVPL
ncbi:MAG: bacillithiol biosynthesis BshC, partial [Planctomycetes bacterium]|nr:bacillithiol biosynthesis BshC [Planctomycetota bacterium]